MSWTHPSNDRRALFVSFDRGYLSVPTLCIGETTLFSGLLAHSLRMADRFVTLTTYANQVSPLPAIAIRVESAQGQLRETLDMAHMMNHDRRTVFAFSPA